MCYFPRSELCSFRPLRTLSHGGRVLRVGTHAYRGAVLLALLALATLSTQSRASPLRSLIVQDQKKPAAPPEPERTAILKRLQKTFKADYSRTDREGRRALAAKLLQFAEGDELRPDSGDPEVVAQYYVVLDQTRWACLEGQDLLGAFDAVDRLASDFHIDAETLKHAAACQAAPTLHLAPDESAAVDAVVEIIEGHIEAGRYSKAAQLYGETEKYRVKIKGNDLLPRFRRGRLLIEEHDLYSVAHSALETKKEAAMLDELRTVGLYLCLAQGKFEAGLAILERCNDPLLLGIVAKEKTGGPNAKGRKELGAEWRQLSTTLAGASKVRALVRAQRWCNAALAELKGLDVREAQNLLAEIDAALESEPVLAGLPAVTAPPVPKVSPFEIGVMYSGYAEESIQGKLVRYDFKLKLMSIDATNGGILGQITWTSNATGTHTIEGRLGLTSSPVLLSFKETAVVVEGTAGLNNEYSFQLPTSRAPVAELTGSWKEEKLGVRGSALLRLRPAQLEKSRPTKAPKLARLESAPQDVQRAIQDGLRWLVRHQNEDGSWSAATLADRCASDNPSYKPKKAYRHVYDSGSTGLALLAFMRFGLSDESKAEIVDTSIGRRHSIGEIVRKGLASLIAQRQDDGSFTADRAFMYNEAIAAMALVEAHAAASDDRWRDAAQNALDYLQAAQRPHPNPDGVERLWGWRYASRQELQPPSGKDADAQRELYDADTSVTAWCITALRAGADAGLKVDQRSLEGGLDFVRHVTQVGGDGLPTGLVGYLDAKGAGAKVTGTHDDYIYHPAVMSALAVCIQNAASNTIDEAFLLAAANQVVKDLPSVSRDKLSVDYYYWYNATRALRALANPKARRVMEKCWAPWSAPTREALLALQDRTDRSCTNGGWITLDRWGHGHSGPIYTTALAVLTLESMYTAP